MNQPGGDLLKDDDTVMLEDLISHGPMSQVLLNNKIPKD
jgi:hypothetical protein